MSTDPTADLRVTRLGLSPMKGTRHLSHKRVTLDSHGPVGDRQHCLVDPQTGRVLRTVQHPQLLEITAEETETGLQITVPSGARATVPDAGHTGLTQVGPAQPDPTLPASAAMTVDYWGRAVTVQTLPGEASQLFSTHLGREVLLARAPRGEVVYGGQVTLLHEASLRALQAASGLPEQDQLWHRFRPTAVVVSDTHSTPAFAEESWQGREVGVGTARLLLGAPVPRCAVIDIDPLTGERSGDLLKTLAAVRPVNERGEPSFGVFATVLSPGTMGLGDQFAF